MLLLMGNDARHFEADNNAYLRIVLIRREKVGEQNQVVIVDLANANDVMRRPSKLDSCLSCLAIQVMLIILFLYSCHTFSHC